MNDVIRYVLPKYLDYIDVVNLAKTCKYYHYLLEEILYKMKLEKQKQIEEIFNFVIIDIVNKNNLLNARYIEFKNLLDFQDFKNFKGSIAYSKDIHNRGFIFTKVKVETPIENNLPEINYTMMILYQKYSDVEIYFVSDPKNYCITTLNGGVFLERDYYHHFKNFYSLGSFYYSDFPYELPFPPLYQKLYMFKEENDLENV